MRETSHTRYPTRSRPSLRPALLLWPMLHERLQRFPTVGNPLTGVFSPLPIYGRLQVRKPLTDAGFAIADTNAVASQNHASSLMINN